MIINKMKDFFLILEEKIPLNELKNISKFSDRKKYADSLFATLLGKGSSRYVYEINDKYVLKLAKNNKGIEQNKTEINIFKNSKVKDILAKIIEYDENGIFIVQERAESIINDNDFERITNLQFDGFLYYLRHDKKWDGDNKQFYNKFNSLINKFDLDRYDISQKDSYGIINGERIVLVDYGLDMNTARKLYGIKY